MKILNYRKFGDVTIVDGLMLVQSPIHKEDILVHILNQLGDDYGMITVPLKVLEQPISYPELFHKLVGFERSLKETESSTMPLIVTASYSQRQPVRFSTRSSPVSYNHNSWPKSSTQHKGNRLANTP